MKQDNELSLRISAKYNRIYIHRTTLKAIGNPEFVSLGIHPQSKKLVVLAAEEATADALRVRCWEDNSFCIQSEVFWTVSARWHRRSGHRIPACCTEGC